MSNLSRLQIRRKKIEMKKSIKKMVMPDKLFMSKHIWITNKAAERQLLNINDIQDIIEQTIIDLQKNNIPPRIIILKARQEGVSTYVQGKMISNTVQKKDRVGLIVAHKEDSVRSIFKKAKFMFDNLPEGIKPLRKASNAKELIFDKPEHDKSVQKGLNSSIKVSIAGNEDIGRGDTIQYCHLSEFAFWKGSNDNSPEAQLSAITQAVPKALDTFVIIESTAKGFNCFKDTWDKAVAGENGFTPLFFAWHDMAEYRIEFRMHEDKQKFIATMDDYEKEIQQRFDLELEQLNWYRTTKQTNCNNNYDKMKQENPSFPDEAFIFTGTPVFNNELVMQRINVLEREYKNKKLKIGKFNFEWSNPESKDKISDDTITFRNDKNGGLTIYEEPEKGYYYAIGGDTKGEGKDSYTATVINNITKKQVAVLKMQISNSKPYTWQIYCLARYYNDAMVAIEINFNTSPIEELERLLYFRMYQRETYDSITGKYQKKYGWKTDGTTRPLIIDKQVYMVENNIDNIRHIETLREMLTFVEDKNGRPDAMSGKHDDLLFSDMIVRETSKQQVCVADKEVEVDNRKEMFYNDVNGQDDEYYLGGGSKWQN